jgi:hypothetical protein
MEECCSFSGVRAMSVYGAKRKCRNARVFPELGLIGCAIRLPATAALDPNADQNEFRIDRVAPSAKKTPSWVSM